MERHKKYSEILVLSCLLTKKGIPHQIEHLLDGYHLGYPSLISGNIKASIIEHQASCGSKYNTLEMWWKGKNIRGFMSADAVFEEIENDFNEKR